MAPTEYDLAALRRLVARAGGEHGLARWARIALARPMGRPRGSAHDDYDNQTLLIVEYMAARTGWSLRRCIHEVIGHPGRPLSWSREHGASPRSVMTRLIGHARADRLAAEATTPEGWAEFWCEFSQWVKSLDADTQDRIVSILTDKVCQTFPVRNFRPKSARIAHDRYLKKGEQKCRS